MNRRDMLKATAAFMAAPSLVKSETERFLTVVAGDYCPAVYTSGHIPIHRTKTAVFWHNDDDPEDRERAKNLAREAALSHPDAAVYAAPRFFGDTEVDLCDRKVFSVSGGSSGSDEPIEEHA